MKKLALIILLFSTSLFVHAQNKEIEAIAAYQMAEEHFDAKNHEAALKHINTTKTILGTANSKILYLEVQILGELSQENPEYLKDLQSAIHAFEQAPDIDEFSQEKRVEVAKVKMDLGKRKAAFEKETQGAKNTEEAIAHLFTMFPKPEGSIGAFATHPYAEYISLNSIKKNKGVKISNGEFSYHYYYIYNVFTNHKENERVITYLRTDAKNIVESYSVIVEITDTDATQTISNLLGMSDFDAVFTFDENKDNYHLRGEAFSVFIKPEVKSSFSKYKRYKKSGYIHYIELSILQTKLTQTNTL